MAQHAAMIIAGLGQGAAAGQIGTVGAVKDNTLS